MVVGQWSIGGHLFAHVSSFDQRITGETKARDLIMIYYYDLPLLEDRDETLNPLKPQNSHSNSPKQIKVNFAKFLVLF